ncbi:unnamed protein product [Absidia cylindrospora]
MTRPQRDPFVTHSQNKRGKWTPDRTVRAIEAAVEYRPFSRPRKDVATYWNYVIKATNMVDPGETPLQLASIREHINKAASDAKKKHAMERLQTGTNDSETTLDTKALELAKLIDEATFKQNVEKDKDDMSKLIREKRDKQAKQSKQGIIGMHDQQASVVSLILEHEGNDNDVFFVDDDAPQATTNEGMNSRRRRVQNDFIGRCRQLKKNVDASMRC